MNRIDFLREKFNIISEEEYAKLTPISEDFDYYYYKDEEGKLFLRELVFDALVECDPTKNKMYLQWLLGQATKRMVLSDDFDAPNTLNIFIDEDLPKTTDNLILFDTNKRKKKFKELAGKNFATKNLTDPTNINQYVALDQLYAAVYPFKPPVDVSELENQLQYYVDIGEAEIPVKDEFYTVFIPKTLNASELFSFTSWCTARPGNSMFASYRDNTRKPDGSLSDLYIVIDNEFFKGENENIYQIHFESTQIRDKADRMAPHFNKEVLQNNTAVRNFIFETLKELTHLDYQKWMKGGNKNGGFGDRNSGYVKYILEFGFIDILFDVMDEGTTALAYEKLTIPKLPSVAKFQKLRTLYMDNVGLVELHDDLFKLKELEMISIPRNKITKLPKSIGGCKNVKFINLLDNPIVEIPDTIKYLDQSNGGSLFRLTISNEFPGLARLKELLPSVAIGYN